MNGTSFNEMIEPYLDDDLDTASTEMFEAELAKNADLSRSLDQALALREAMASLPRYRLPARRAAQIDAQTWQHTRRWPAMAAIAATLVVAVMLVMLTERTPPVADQIDMAQADPTQQELEQAREDIAVALAYLDHAGDVMGREVGTLWVDQGIKRPVNAGMREVPGKGRAGETRS